MGVVDSSFFWGYIVTQIPGGFLAARFPANRVFGSAIATSALLNMLLPIGAKAGFQYVMLLRILQGLVEVSSGQRGVASKVAGRVLGAAAGSCARLPAHFRRHSRDYLHSGANWVQVSGGGGAKLDLAAAAAS